MFVKSWYKKNILFWLYKGYKIIMRNL